MSDDVTVDEQPDCDIHKVEKNTTVPAYYDGKTKRGPWAYMCESCFRSEGIGLGLGKGQRLILRSKD